MKEETKQIRVYKTRWRKLKKEATDKEISIADLIEEEYGDETLSKV